jgi:hypothetical protein
MVPDFVVNSADGADAPITLPVITSPVAGRQLAANAGRILAGRLLRNRLAANSPQSRGGCLLQSGPISLPVTGRMVPGSAWPGACNRPLGASASVAVTVPRFTGATIRPAVSAPNTPVASGLRSLRYSLRCIRPAVSPGMADNHWPAYSQPLGELPPRGLRFRSASGALHHGWRNGGFGRLPEHIRVAYTDSSDCHWPVSRQLRCPANSVASRSAVASPRCVRPDRYRLPGQLPLWPATSCVGVHVATAPGMLGIAGLSPVSLASGVLVFCSPGTDVKLPEFPPVACQYRGANRQALQCAERMFVDFRLNGQVECRRPVG